MSPSPLTVLGPLSSNNRITYGAGCAEPTATGNITGRLFVMN